MESTNASGVSQVLNRELGSEGLFEVTGGPTNRTPVLVRPSTPATAARVLDAARVLAASGYAVKMLDGMGTLAIGGRNTGVDDPVVHRRRSGRDTRRRSGNWGRRGR